MRRKSRKICPACGSAKAQLKLKALIAPWVRELAGVSSRSCLYLICSDCGSGWANLQFSESELSKLYGEYRGDVYVRVRSKWEPTYTLKLNQSLDTGVAVFSLRREALKHAVDSVVAGFSDRARIILDFGGGHGSLIPDWPSIQRKIVLDPSGVDISPGIERIGDLNELQTNGEIDLVLNCMVLEHLNDPLGFLYKLRSDFITRISNPGHTLFYFEVPRGIPWRAKNLPLYFLLNLSSRSRTVWKLWDNLVIKSPRRFPLRIAEHIQFFTSSGLVCLLTRAGFETLKIHDYEGNHALEDAKGIRFMETNVVVARISQ